LPTIACPADVSAQSLDGTAVPITYSAPTTAGGSAPVNVVCSPTSGASFAPGRTPVSCTATDSLSRSATCSFSVSVAVTPKIRYTKFLAFGDSMTEGKVSASPSTLSLFSAPTPESYPSQLQPMLNNRYTAQSITVTNVGIAGMQAVNERDRLDNHLRSLRPEVLLLMEGANDLNAGDDANITAIAEAMEDMVEVGQMRGATVFLATLPPQREGCGAGSKAGAEPGDVVRFNSKLASVAWETKATLVDVYSAIGTPPSTTLIGVDCLHPTAAGYVRIAETFFAAIKEKLDITPKTSATGWAEDVGLGIVVPDSGNLTAAPAVGGSRRGKVSLAPEDGR
jgi:lysophospholipase L1-like esterase